MKMHLIVAEIYNENIHLYKRLSLHVRHALIAELVITCTVAQCSTLGLHFFFSLYVQWVSAANHMTLHNPPPLSLVKSMASFSTNLLFLSHSYIRLIKVDEIFDTLNDRDT